MESNRPADGDCHKARPARGGAKASALRRHRARENVMTDVVHARPQSARDEVHSARHSSFLRTLGLRLLPSALFCVFVLVFWQTMARSMSSPLVPGLGEIAHEINRIAARGLAFQQIAITLSRIV